MSIHIDACSARETLTVNTRSSVYELIVVRGDEGDILVRGGRHFPEFCRARFIGCVAPGGSLEPWRIDIGLRMRFICGDQVVVTSPVESLSWCSPAAARIA